MSLFTSHTPDSATGEAAKVLSLIRERYGFIPNLAAFVAESPLTLGAVLSLSESFDRSGFSPREQQIIQLTVSVLNACEYCRTAHTGLARKAGVDDPTLRALLDLKPVTLPREAALQKFTRAVVDNRGHVPEVDVESFLAAGFSRAQVFECVLGVALKTLTNYCNHLAGARPNAEFIAMANLG